MLSLTVYTKLLTTLSLSCITLYFQLPTLLTLLVFVFGLVLKLFGFQYLSYVASVHILGLLHLYLNDFRVSLSRLPDGNHFFFSYELIWSNSHHDLFFQSQDPFHHYFNGIVSLSLDLFLLNTSDVDISVSDPLSIWAVINTQFNGLLSFFFSLFVCIRMYK